MIGKLIVDNEEYDIHVCEHCGEHEAQKKTHEGMVCLFCYESMCLKDYEGEESEEDEDREDSTIDNGFTPY